jgi:two-component sensor histidine kinase/PAS domain-containing protein
MIWYILNLSFFAKLLMIIGYIPIISAFISIYLEQRGQLIIGIQRFILYLYGIFLLFISYIVITSIPKNVNNIYDIFIYTYSVFGDVVILSLVTLLIIINMPSKLRYLFSIFFGIYLLSFLGDTVSLLGALNLYEAPNYSQLIYAIMMLFISITLLIYALSNIRITSIEEINKKLEDTTLVVEDLLMQSPDAMCMCNDTGIILKANNRFIDIFNLDKENSINLLNIFKDEIIPGSYSKTFLNATNGDTIYLDNIKIIDNTDEKYLSIKLYPTIGSDKKISHYILICEDITLRKKSEEALKASYDQLDTRVKERTAELSILNVALQKEIYEHKIDEEKIKASLKEKEVLLKEIHHRVKNNMQIISSMLGLQSNTVMDEKFNDMLRDSQNRIKSMALIHEKLYQSQNMANVNFEEYINSLVINLYSSYNINRNKINLNIDICDVIFNIDTAIPLGLIINEIISNSLKHAFPDGRNGEIYLRLSKTTDNKYELVIKDNGVGIPSNVDANTTKTLGLKLIYALIEQIDGSISVDKIEGSCYFIEFPYNN